MCIYDGPYDARPEDEHEDNPWESGDSDLGFLPDPDAWEWDADMEKLAGPEYRLPPDPDPRKRRTRSDDGDPEC